MTRDEARLHAWVLAEMLWQRLEPSALGLVIQIAPWPRRMGVYEVLAEFLDRAPEAGVEALYRHMWGTEIGVAPWEKTGRHLRVCLEIFRATYLVLMRAVKADAADAAAADTAAQETPVAVALADRGIGRRAVRKVAGIRSRFRVADPRLAKSEPAATEAPAKAAGPPPRKRK